MSVSKTIYCPVCNRKLATYDGKTTIPIIVNCRNCRKQIIYDQITGNVTAKHIPERKSSSGMTYH